MLQYCMWAWEETGDGTLKEECSLLVCTFLKHNPPHDAQVKVYAKRQQWHNVYCVPLQSRVNTLDSTSSASLTLNKQISFRRHSINFVLTPFVVCSLTTFPPTNEQSMQVAERTASKCVEWLGGVGVSDAVIIPLPKIYGVLCSIVKQGSRSRTDGEWFQYQGQAFFTKEEHAL